MASRTGASIVKKQFEDVLREYHAWEPTHCSEKIASLRVSATAIASTTDFDIVDLAAPAREIQPGTGSASTAAQGASFTRYVVHDSGPSEEEPVCADTIDITISPPTPYPSYESCTPTSRNILHGDDPQSLSFIPFADDPSFDPTDYVLDHTSLAWQEGHSDTDRT